MCVYVILQQGEPPDGAAAGEAPDGAGLLVPDRSKRRVDDRDRGGRRGQIKGGLSGVAAEKTSEESKETSKHHSARRIYRSMELELERCLLASHTFSSISDRPRVYVHVAGLPMKSVIRRLRRCMEQKSAAAIPQLRSDDDTQRPVACIHQLSSYVQLKMPQI